MGIVNAPQPGGYIAWAERFAWFSKAVAWFESCHPASGSAGESRPPAREDLFGRGFRRDLVLERVKHTGRRDTPGRAARDCCPPRGDREAAGSNQLLPH